MSCTSLRHRSSFIELSRSPYRYSFPLMVVQVQFITSPPFPQPYLGYGMIASRKVGNAVVRNRIKRRIRSLIRELFPLMKADLAAHLVVVARRGFEEGDFQKLRDDMKKAFSKFGLLTESGTPS